MSNDLIDTIHNAMDRMRDRALRSDSISISPQLREQLTRAVNPLPTYFSADYASNPDRSIFAFNDVPIHTSPIFPIQKRCSQCEATGKGTDSTYCRPCGGTGEIIVVGVVMHNPGMSFINEPSKRGLKFQPSYPADYGPGPRR